MSEQSELEKKFADRTAAFDLIIDTLESNIRHFGEQIAFIRAEWEEMKREHGIVPKLAEEQEYEERQAQEEQKQPEPKERPVKQAEEILQEQGNAQKILTNWLRVDEEKEPEQKAEAPCGEPDAPAVEKGSDDGEAESARPKQTRIHFKPINKKRRIRVIIRGKTFEEPNSKITFAKAIEFLGASAVYNVCKDHNILVNGFYPICRKEEKRHMTYTSEHGEEKDESIELPGGWFVQGHFPNRDKMRRLMDIGEAMGTTVICDEIKP